MGVLYVSFTLNEETADWLRKNGLSAPSPLPDSRLPTLGELKAVVEQLGGYKSRVGLSKGTRTIDIEVVDQRGYGAGWSTTIWASKWNDRTRPPEDGDSVQFTFHKGSPELAVLIVERLTHVCGPLVLIPDHNCRPLLVTEGLDPRQAVEEWLKD
jgi:hypothetical protein